MTLKEDFRKLNLFFVNHWRSKKKHWARNILKRPKALTVLRWFTGIKANIMKQRNWIFVLSLFETNISRKI